MPTATAREPILSCETKAVWAAWLAKNHRASKGIWLRFAKKGADTPSVTYAEAIDVALCYGWIDGQKQADNEYFWLQRFTPRSAKSIWSKINRDKATKLIASRQMRAAGLKEIERAKQDGRWEAAYDGAKTAVIPVDFQAALDGNAQAKAFFAALNSSNRYAMLFRIHNAKKLETRERRIQTFIQMLANGEKLHP
ncbi:YdeI/OmpD-associated family protein [Dyella tabacisoli]|uniref:Bacteriocin-protection protein n=1 Tax=Dyella tabacisoli TaxID=2282381 RepID=A0A369UR28_9GAMM|nr:YdeI/OmpD-associated family protein [Dyella tabacisoli]RDD83222.1 bacteriocin-protection protein [Dyella tabacisoli]